MKQITTAVVALALFSIGRPAGAQTVNQFMTVDAVDVSPTGNIAVTGVVEGEAAPSTRTASFTYNPGSVQVWARESCHRALLLALSKPGQYVAKVGQNVCTVALVAP